MGVLPVRIGARIALALFVIYVVWGSTYLAVRIAVADIPPLLAAALRFCSAGALLYAWMRWRGASAPTPIEWRNAAIVGALMFLGTYSALFWAEKTLPSGVAAVFVATLPFWTALVEIVVLRRRRARWMLLPALALGFCGIVVLSSGLGNFRLQMLPCLALLGGEICWALGSVLSQSLRLPASNSLAAGAEMMLGGAMLGVCSLLGGELSPWPRFTWPAISAIVYLILAGSLLGYTVYVWLLAHMSATAVSSHAYVNPVVALALGYWLGGEPLGARTLIGAALICASVFLTMRSTAGLPKPALAEEMPEICSSSAAS